jgi:hypothetical protein
MSMLGLAAYDAAQARKPTPSSYLHFTTSRGRRKEECKVGYVDVLRKDLGLSGHFLLCAGRFLHNMSSRYIQDTTTTLRSRRARFNTSTPTSAANTLRVQRHASSRALSVSVLHNTLYLAPLLPQSLVRLVPRHVTRPQRPICTRRTRSRTHN